MCVEMYALFSGRFSVNDIYKYGRGIIAYMKITSTTTQPYTKLWLHIGDLKSEIFNLMSYIFLMNFIYAIVLY